MADAIVLQIKRCTKCGENKPVTSFNKAKAGKYGVRAICKDCQSAEGAEYRTKNADKERERHAKDYRENKEKRTSTVLAARLRNPEIARRASRKYRETHLEEVRAKERAAYAADSDKYKEKQRRYLERHPERIKVRQRNYRVKFSSALAAQSKAWRKRNTDHVKAYTARYEALRRTKRNAQRRIDYAANPERHRLARKEWTKFNPEKVRLGRRNRRARLKAAEGRHTLADLQRLFILQRGRCPVCRLVLKDYHVDHIVALARGGSNGPTNLQLLHPLCNQRKNAKDPIEFMQEQGFLL